jgi:lipid-A-disaccharide synthase-like uncharacterized protein
MDQLIENLRNPWVIVGFLGQGIFSARFLLQWVQSERAGRSIMPLAFWWLSLVGSALLLTYSLHKQDLVFILGQSAGFIVYTRNLVLLRKESS